MEMTAERKGQ